MKRFTLISLALAALLTLSCQKNIASVDAAPQEIVLAIDSDDLVTDVQTKTTAVNSLPASLYWGATTGSGSESAKWASASATVSASKINTGKYQTVTPTTYNYYVSNVSMSVGANTTVSATGGTSGTDVICGRASSDAVSPAVTLGHIFARTGSITTNVQNGNGTLTGVSYTIVKKDATAGTAGTYNLRTGAWSSVSGLTSATAITGSSDMYVIPGNYTIAVTATYTRGDYVVTQTKAGDVDLTAGKVNNITLTWPEGGSEIRITCTLTAWSSQAVAMNIGYYCPSVDMGGTSTVLYASYNLGASSETDYGDYYAWAETSKRYTNTAASLQNNNTVTLTGTPFATDWSNTPYHIGTDYSTGWTKYIPTSQASYWGGEGSPDNKTTLDPSDDVAHLQWGGDWRLPTYSELSWLVNSTNCDWTWQSDYNGSGVNGYLVTSKHNSASLFLPCAGYCVGSYRNRAGTYGYYWSSSLRTSYPHYAYYLCFRGIPEGGDFGCYMSAGSRCSGFSVRAVRSRP